MLKLIAREDLGTIEELFSPRTLVSLPFFGFKFRFLVSRSRTSRMTGKRIAIIVQHHDNAWERRVVKGLVVSMLNAFAPEESPLFDVFSCQSSAEYLQENIIPSLVQKKKEYGVVVTTGAWVSTQVKQYMQQHNLTMPQLFVGVPDAVGAGLIKNFEIPQAGIIGVNAAPLDYDKCLTMLKEVVPSLLSVLIPFDASIENSGFELDRQRLVQQLGRHGIEVKLLPINNQEDVVDQLLPHLPGVSVLWSVYEPLLQISAKRVARACAKFNVVNCASELASVFQGADIGWGDSGSVAGAYAGQVCFALLMGIPTIHIKNVETMSCDTLRTNPSFLDHSTLSEHEKHLIQDVVPLGWD